MSRRGERTRVGGQSRTKSNPAREVATLQTALLIAPQAVSSYCPAGHISHAWQLRSVEGVQGTAWNSFSLQLRDGKRGFQVTEITSGNIAVLPTRQNAHSSCHTTYVVHFVHALFKPPKLKCSLGQSAQTIIPSRVS
jgi:hypothetical protein